MNKLMIVTHDLEIGGLQQVIVNICKTINRQEFDTSVVCLKALGPFTEQVSRLGIRVHLIHNPKGAVDYFSFTKLARIFRDEQIEIIHTHNTHPMIDGTIAALMSGVKTIVHTDHARDFPDKRRYMFAEWLMSLFCYKVVGVSKHTVSNLKKFERISSKKLLVIPNGIDGESFDIIIEKEKKIKELGIRNHGPIIGIGVRLSEQKGIKYLLQAMPEVIEAIPDITLVIAGEGPLESDLKRIALSMGISNNVLFIGPRLDIPELLKLFDVYVLPSLWEGLPMVLLEAMAAGCPIIATDVGGNSTAITHRLNGSLVEPRNPKALAQEILLLLSDYNLRSKYIKLSKEIFNTRFSADIMTKTYEKLYLREF